MLTTIRPEMALSEPLLKLEGVRKYYPIKKGVFSRTVGQIKAVDGIDLNIYPGETVGLVGESGCGKSTLGRSIIKLEELTEGRVLYQGQNLAP
ncbi:ATP-binding cassette domain-containing protein, partial [Paenibacillus sepulcri]|nr:ATP-binding cassette domain-containing protein [Paenibacillus sepulcri]